MFFLVMALSFGGELSGDVFQPQHSRLDVVDTWVAGSSPEEVLTQCYKRSMVIARATGCMVFPRLEGLEELEDGISSRCRADLLCSQ